MSALVQLINYLLCKLILSLELKNHMLDTSSHFTAELLICAADDLTMSKFVYTSRLELLLVTNLKHFFMYLFI